MSATARLAVPLLSPGQAQKELFHNEALQLLDVLVAAAVEEPPRQGPPEAPAVGSCYIIAADATGAWSGRGGSIAAFSSGGWRFIGAVEGMSALVKSSGTTAVFRSGAWSIGEVRGTKLVVAGQQVVGVQGGAIAGPSGGATVDAQARAVIETMLSALRQHGLIAG